MIEQSVMNANKKLKKGLEITTRQLIETEKKLSDAEDMLVAEQRSHMKTVVTGIVLYVLVLAVAAIAIWLK